MKKILIGLGGVIVLLVIAAMVVPALIPAEVYEDKIETAATEALGREVTIGGAPKVSVFPPRLTVNELLVANAEGYDAEFFASVSEADIGVKLFPLLSRQVEITKFHLKDPVINLEASNDGGNWELGSEPAAEPEAESSNGGGTAVRDVRLGDVKITGGQLTYTTPDGTVWEARDADLVFTLDSMDQPFELAGTMQVQDKPTEVQAMFSTPRRYADTGAADMSLKMRVGENRADMDLALTDELTFDGNLDIDFPALRALFSLVGAELGTENGFERLRLAGPVTGNTSRLAFGEGTEVQFDEISGSGNITIDVAGARPAVSGTMTLGTLDMTPYLPPEPEEFKAVKSGEKASFPEWSTDPMDFSALGAIDADLAISTGELILPSLTIGESDLNVRSTAGDMRVTVNKTSLYGGSGSGVLTMNVSGIPRMGVNFELTGVNAGAVAQELVGLSRLKGTGDITITNLSVQGRSQAEFVRSLNGALSLDLADGAIEGVNLGKIGRAALSAYDSLTGEGGGLNAPALISSVNSVVTEARGPTEETDFSDLLIAMNIRNGLVRSDTFSLAGPYYRITGEAEANLPEQTMAMDLTPAVQAEGSDNQRALPVPIRVSGTFNEPRVGVNMDSVINGAVRNRVGDALGVDLSEGKTLEESLRNTAQEELQRRLFGDPDEEQNPDSDSTDDQPQEQRPEDALIEQGLNSLFGGNKDDDGGR
ncbi:MAG: AsmA family protein [Pseudomonadota bacterium]